MVAFSDAQLQAWLAAFLLPFFRILALFSAAPVDFIATLLQDDHHVGLLVACKAARLTWPAVAEILAANFSNHGLSGAALEEAEKSYLLFSELSAQRNLQVMISRLSRSCIAIRSFFSNSPKTTRRYSTSM